MKLLIGSLFHIFFFTLKLIHGSNYCQLPQKYMEEFNRMQIHTLYLKTNSFLKQYYIQKKSPENSRFLLIDVLHRSLPLPATNIIFHPTIYLHSFTMWNLHKHQRHMLNPQYPGWIFPVTSVNCWKLLINFTKSSISDATEALEIHTHKTIYYIASRKDE